MLKEQSEVLTEETFSAFMMEVRFIFFVRSDFFGGSQAGQLPPLQQTRESEEEIPPGDRRPQPCHRLLGRHQRRHPKR